MSHQTNPELELAFDYINNTQTNVYLTGKAGTGKTTFLHRIRQETLKRLAVVAPTGVAAINAKGMTIHSLFQLPFGPYLAGNRRDAAHQRKFSREKIHLIQSLDLLVIDEISMVRADVLDAIDDVLRRYRDFTKPFGGVQLLMIGDLHQLPPVVKDDDWALLRAHYETPYFFSSHALQSTRPVVIELKHIYRQSDEAFIQLLNNVRDRQIDRSLLDVLNSRYLPGFQPDEAEPYITLSTHNATVQAINSEKLAAQNGPLFSFRATIEGDFPSHAYPADEVLEVKTGAQVMFIKNDTSRERRYYNGKIGKVVEIREGAIYVSCPDDPDPIQVSPVEWQNIRYTLNEQTKEIVEDVLGSFSQYPLKLAWAITIHKSQGLTFERVLLDAKSAFAHGQVYVALSRCKSFEGLVLRSPIPNSAIRTDAVVQQYSEEASKNAPDKAHLKQSKTAFQQALLRELFGFSLITNRMEHLNRVLLEHEGSLHASALEAFRELQEHVAGVVTVADTFGKKLDQYVATDVLPEEHPELQEYVRKAAAWFAPKLITECLPVASKMTLLTDNKEVRQLATEALDNLQEALYVKHACLAAAQNGFKAQAYLRQRTDAALDFKLEKTKKAAVTVPPGVRHPELYAKLKAWRETKAQELKVELFQVLPSGALVEIALLLPVTEAALRSVRSFGRQRYQQHGAELLALVRDYCRANNINHDVAEKPRAATGDTKVQSLTMFLAGKSIPAIAAERGLVTTTIEGHLAHFVEIGMLDVQKVVAETDVQTISAFFAEHPAAPSSEAKAHFGEAYSYGVIKLVMAHLRAKQNGVL